MIDDFLVGQIFLCFQHRSILLGHRLVWSPEIFLLPVSREPKTLIHVSNTIDALNKPYNSILFQCSMGITRQITIYYHCTMTGFILPLFSKISNARRWSWSLDMRTMLAGTKLWQIQLNMRLISYLSMTMSSLTFVFFRGFDHSKPESFSRHPGSPFWSLWIRSRGSLKSDNQVWLWSFESLWFCVFGS